MRETIAVTGGAGFIGSHLVDHLLEENPDKWVLVIDNMSTGHRPEWVRQREGKENLLFDKKSVLNPFVRDTFIGMCVTQVYHLAAETHVDRSLTDPTHFWKTNTLGTQQVLMACRDAGVDRVVVMSTDEVYGTTYLPVDEQAPFRPTSPYATSKAAADMAARSAHLSFDLDVSIARCVNAYGPHQYPEKLIPAALAANEHKPLQIYGNGESVRQWVHVEDIARALCSIMDFGSGGEAYNITSGISLSVNDVVSHLEIAIGREIPKENILCPRGAVQDHSYCLNGAKLKALDSGWEARTFASGLRSFL